MKRIIPLLSILIATAAHAAGPQPGANPWDWGNYPGLAYSLGGIVLPSTVTGGQKGVGTINAQGYFYNGQPMPTLGGSTPTVGHCLQWGTNGIIDAGGVCTTGGGGGTVTSATANYLAYYATTGNAVTGLATVNNGTLVTSIGGVPFFATTLPNAVQANITQLGTISSGAIPLGLVTGINATVATDLANPPNAASGLLIYGGAYGTPSSLGLANATGLPISTGLSGANSGAVAAMANNVNASGGLLTYGLIGTSGATIPLNNQPFQIINSGVGSILEYNPSGYLPGSIDPVNGLVTSPFGTFVSYCSATGCFTGDHLFTQTLFSSTTRLDASAQEVGVAINMLSNTGEAPNWIALHAYSVAGYQVLNSNNIYSVLTPGTSGNSGGPTCGSGTCTDGTVTWNYVGAGLNNGKTALSIAQHVGSNSGNAWVVAIDQVVDAGSNLVATQAVEIDKSNNLADCAPGTLNCSQVYMNGSSAYPVLAYLWLDTASSTTTFQSHYGIFSNNAKAVKDAFIFDGTNATYGLFVQGAHQTGIALEGTYSGAPESFGAATSPSACGGTGELIQLYGNPSTRAASDYSIGINFGYLTLCTATGGLQISGGAGGTTLLGQFDSSGNLQFLGHAWSNGSAPSLSSCGTGSPSLSTGANDTHGTITEGTAATGCTLTFATARTNNADCIVMPWGGSGVPLTAYNATGGVFTYTHASVSGQKFTYQCMGK